MNANERADAIIKDILDNHLPRIVEGLKLGYVDENQVLIIYDHAVRARILKEFAKAQPALEHVDNLARLNRELEAEWRAEMLEKTQGKTVGDIPPYDPATFVHPNEVAQNDLALHGTKLVNVPSPDAPCGILKQVPAVPRKLKDEIESGVAIVHGRNTVSDHECYVQEIGDTPVASKLVPDKGRAKLLPVDVAKKLAKQLTTAYADMTFDHQVVSDMGWSPTVNMLQCACGGLVKEFPTSVEPLLKCERCERVYVDEEEVFKTRKTETIVPQKCPDATYWTTGTLVNGVTPMATGMEINLNGRKAVVRGVNGQFKLTYEQIVRLTISQQRGNIGDFTMSDDQLPNLSCTYSHRVEFSQLPGERVGSLCRGQSVQTSPGMVITCIGTGNA